MEPTAARNPVNSSILFFLYLLSDAAVSTPQKKNLPFCYQQKNWYTPNGSNNSNKCLQRLSIQIAKQHKTTRSLHKRRAKNLLCGKKFWIKRRRDENRHQSSPKPKHVPINFSKRGRRVAMASILREHLLSPSLFGISCLKLQLSFLVTFIFSYVYGVCA
jgi:uncharacterized UBP type Zn finger protein